MVPLIRFPLFDVTQLAALLSGTGLVSEQAMVLLYTHVGSRAGGAKVRVTARANSNAVLCSTTTLLLLCASVEPNGVGGRLLRSAAQRDDVRSEVQRHVLRSQGPKRP
jgi:hypothetical protein